MTHLNNQLLVGTERKDDTLMGEKLKHIKAWTFKAMETQIICSE